MATVQKTFAFATDAEGLTDQAVSGVTFAFDGTDGNPAGCVKFTFGSKSSTATERGSSSGLTWQDYGVPSGATVNSVRVASYSRKTAANSKLTSHSLVIRVGGRQCSSESLPTATGAWLAGSGLAAAGAPVSGSDLELEYTVTTGGGGGSASTDARVDQVAVEVDYTTGATPVSGSGGVSFGFSTSGSGTVELPAVTGTGSVSFGFSTAAEGTFTAPSVAGSGGVSFGASTAGTGAYTPPAISGSGGVTFGFSVSGAGNLGVPAFTGSGGVAFTFATSGSGEFTAPSSEVSGSGGVAFGMSTAGEGSYTPPAITGSGGVTFGFSTSGNQGDGPPWISHGTIHLARPPINH